MMQRIGFACKWETSDQQLKESITCKSTTLRHIGSLSSSAKHSKLESVVLHNLKSTERFIQKVGELPPLQRMCRLTSDLLPLKTHEIAADFWSSSDINLVVERSFSKIGEIAKSLGVRLSFHPGQFTVLNSVNEGIVLNSIREVEMHAEIAQQLGASGWHSDGWAINIHAGSKAGGLDRLKSNIARLSSAAQGLLTIENDEFSWNVEQLVHANLPVPIVIDLHHHWISEGAHLSTTDPLVERVIEGWRGVRPKLHAAMSIQGLLPDSELASLPSLQKCLLSGQTKTSLRAHSDDAWHRPTNDYFRTWLPKFDLMFEGKFKQIGAEQIARPLLQG